jgi:hypothetical protein
MAIDYNSAVGPIPNNTGVFPDVVSNNVTAPLAGDGTPYVKAGIDDAWGRFQDLLNRGGLTPNGASEAAGSSQHFEALRRCFSFPGEVVMWHGQADPATLGIRLLLLQGQGILRANYPELDAAVYIGDGNNGDIYFPYYFHADDAGGTIRNTAGIYLILADARGVIIRGHDPTAQRDPEGATRKFPDIQLKAIWQHGHELITSTSGYYAKVTDYDLHGGGNNTCEFLPNQTNDRLQATSVLQGGLGSVVSNTYEGRMINLNTKFCVRY